MAFPKRVDLEVTNSCTLNCIMCPRKYMTRPIGFMEFSLVEKIVAEVSEKKKTEKFDHMPVHQMGEPLLHPQILDIVKLIVDNGIICVLTTSGLLLTEHIACELLKIPIQCITISLDSIDSEQYHKIRNGSHLLTVLENIDRLLELRNKMNSTTNIDLVTIEMFSTTGQADAIAERYEKHLRSLGGRVVSKKFAKWGGAVGGLSHIESIEAPEPCVQMNISEIVQWNGNVSICCLDYNGQTTVGNAYDQTIEEIWNGKRFEEFRTRIRSGDKSTPFCGNCHHLWKAKEM